MVKQCMVFAAGFGKRLLPLTHSQPKALIKIGGKPMLQRLLLQLEELGVQRVVINAHHHAVKIQQFLQEYSFKIDIQLSIEEEILGTGAGLKAASKYLEQQDCWLYNADILCDADLKIMHQHQNHQVLATLAVQKREDSSLVHANSKGFIQGFGSAKSLPKNCFAYGFCGIHLLSAGFWAKLNAMSTVPFSIIEVYKQLLSQGHGLQIWDIQSANWVDIGTFEGLKTAEHFLNH